MKREAVQEERQRGAKMLPKQGDDLSHASFVRDLTIERLMEAEQKAEARSGDNAIPYLRVAQNSVVQAEYKVLLRGLHFRLMNYSNKFISPIKGVVSHLCQMVNKQLFQLIDYARRTPHFAQLQREDQITLLRAGWNELLIATVAWRSIEVSMRVSR